MKKILWLVMFFGYANEHQAQNYSDKVWCFGDSAGVNFSNAANPSFFSPALRTRGTCVSIADSNDSLLFYAFTNAVNPPYCGLVYNREHQLMSNGDNLQGTAWYNEMIIIPKPGSDSLFYLFTVGVTGSGPPGLSYSIIDLSLDSGRGEVIQKNVTMLNFEMFSCIAAVKHGNGRDWWVMFKPSGAVTANNQFYEYLVTPAGISGPFIFQISALSYTNAGHFAFSNKGNRMAFTDWNGTTEIYDFNRCTGVLSNPKYIQGPSINPPFPFTTSVAFSPDDSLLYISTAWQIVYLFQYKIYVPVIPATKDTIGVVAIPLSLEGGSLKMAPDEKIYWSIAWSDGVNFNYPYDSTAYNLYNMNLSVINQPNVQGAGCDFQPFSFYLGGKRTYYGLPNNPVYSMGALAGSVCDTLTGISNNEQGISNAELLVTWVQEWEKLFVNAKGLKGKMVRVEVYDMTGKKIYASPPVTLQRESGETHYCYFTQDIFLTNLSTGGYLVRLITEKEALSKKFVKR